MKKTAKALRISDRWDRQPILKLDSNTKSNKKRVWKTKTRGE